MPKIRPTFSTIRTLSSLIGHSLSARVLLPRHLEFIAPPPRVELTSTVASLNGTNRILFTPCSGTNRVYNQAI
jgi:hypothetical protein